MKFNALKEKILLEKRAYMKNVKPEIKSLVEANPVINWETYQSMKMNSYERYLVIKLLDDEAYIKLTEQYIEQAGYEFREYPEYSLNMPGTYDEALQRIHIHELIKRFKEWGLTQEENNVKRR
jgi:uncharacterized protein YnzC (UPF0291/DUF896 family)